LTERPGDVVVVTGHGVADLFGYYGRDVFAPTLLAADPGTAAIAYDALRSTRASGAYHLPYLDAPPHQPVRAPLAAARLPGENRFFRNQRAEYFALPGPNFPPFVPIDAKWGGSIELRRAAVGPARAAPGDAVAIALEWTTADAAPDLKLSLRLLGPDGKQVAQLAGRPADGARPL